ncbi:MAG: hypothetical protein HOD43_06060 [Candidatus Marinimicrobia bacterium]|jgi:hypothetical protein|nr:hypothetical protein [Candidatus Neomarinimicrobiota bacterium]MBT3629904.1 hypothetical protein [Candidatus Neomarinimicrobiota bacterium]MBT3824486.1 hypothetical protein [Candidatus Neomarinimicrobiota bacterium]MBT4132765.1 hypothetical protein [Candidatus Neomarinimicrobiota bacterium]MBT4295356.1 hypothetical protein [Candidatus Neomarinimicrobiota bacterium]
MNKIITISILLSALFLGSCSTLSFIPTEGGASKFNLATVEYVQAQNAAQQDDLVNDLAENLSVMLDSVLMEDRAALMSMTAQLDSINNIIFEFSTKIDSSELLVEKSIMTMKKELTTMKTNASSTRMVIRRINDNIDNLPVKALETFNEAINEYLTKDEAPTE